MKKWQTGLSYLLFSMKLYGVVVFFLKRCNYVYYTIKGKLGERKCWENVKKAGFQEFSRIIEKSSD